MKIRITERQLKKISLLIEDTDVVDNNITTIVNNIKDYLPLKKKTGDYDGITLLQSILVDSGYCVYPGDCGYIDGDFGGTTEESLNDFIGVTSLETTDDLETLKGGMLDPDKIGPEKTTKSYDNTITLRDKVLTQRNWYEDEGLKEKLGNKYVWGTDGPDTFDCSGFVNWFYETDHGNRAVNHYHKYGDKNITKNNVQLGDLVFFKTTQEDAGHVGIVIKNSTPGAIEFIHASGSECCNNWRACLKNTKNKTYTDEQRKEEHIRKNSVGCRVKIDKLNKGNYNRTFIGFGRIPKEDEI